MSVMGNLLNDESKQYANKKISIVPLDELFPNEFNQAPIENIEELIISIKEVGLQTPLLVYREFNHHYVILNGERRYTALKCLDHDEVPVIIVPKPETAIEERLIILDANAQRDETMHYKRQRAKEYKELYYLLKQENMIPKGMLMIDWVGNHMNVDGRTVQRYLKEDVSKDIQKHKYDEFNDLKDHMQRKIQTQIKFKKNAFTVSFSSIDDLNRILELLNLHDIVNE